MTDMIPGLGIFAALVGLALVGRAGLPKNRALLRFWLLMVAFSSGLMTIGGLSNFAVCLVNEGKMPVLTEDVGDSPEHCVLTEKSRLPMLADRIYIPRPFGGWRIASIGDALIIIGILCAPICFLIFLFKLEFGSSRDV